MSQPLPVTPGHIPWGSLDLPHTQGVYEVLVQL